MEKELGKNPGKAGEGREREKASIHNYPNFVVRIPFGTVESSERNSPAVCHKQAGLHKNQTDHIPTEAAEKNVHRNPLGKRWEGRGDQA